MYSTNKKPIAKLLKYFSYIYCTPYIRKNAFVRITNSYYQILFNVISAFSVLAGAGLLPGLWHVKKFGNTVQFVSSLGITVKFFVFLHWRVLYVSIARIEEVIVYLNQMERLEISMLKQKSKRGTFFIGIQVRLLM